MSTVENYGRFIEEEGCFELLTNDPPQAHVTALFTMRNLGSSAESMAARLGAEGITQDKIAVIHNWSPIEMAPSSAQPTANPLREEWNLGQKFVVGYSGNFGRAHDFATVLDAAAALRDLPDVHFLFVGAGAQLAWVKSRTVELGLTNVSFQPYQPLERLAVRQVGHRGGGVRD